MSKRQGKLNSLISDHGERLAGDQQFGLYLTGLTPSNPVRRRIARRVMSARRQIYRKHGIRITSWKWVDSHGCRDAADPLSRVSCVAVSLYGRKK